MPTVAELIVGSSRLGPMIEEMLSNKIIDLREVEETLVRKYGWTMGQALACSGKYVRLLALSALLNDEVLTPPPTVDGFWKCHYSLDAGQYRKFCISVFEKEIPRYISVAHLGRIVSAEETATLYFAVFREHLVIPETIHKRARIRYAMRQSAFY